MKKIATLALFVLSCIQSFAQPSETFLGEDGRDILQHVVPAPDGNFYAVGSRTIGADPAKIWLLKIGPDAQVIWEKTYALNDPALEERGYGISVMPDGSLILTGAQRTDDVFVNEKALALKTDAQGNQLWKRTYANVNAVFDAAPVGNNVMLVGWTDYTGSSDGGQILLVNANGILQWKLPIEVVNQTKVRRIFPTNDGKVLLVGRSNAIGVGFEGIFLRKIEPDGTQIWQTTQDLSWEEPFTGFGTDDYNTPLGAVQQPDGSIWITEPTEYYADIALLHYSSNGTLLSKKIYGSPDALELPYHLNILPNGNFLISGEALVNNSYQGLAMMTDPNGLELWRQYYGSGSSTDRLFGSVGLPGGDLLFAGGSNFQAGGGTALPDGWLLRTQSGGNALPWVIQGKIVVDLNNNCQEDPGEPPARHWFVNVTDTTTHTLNTDVNGFFKWNTGTGNTVVTALAPAAQSSIWTFCQNDIPVLSDAGHPVENITFLVQSADGGCPHTEVSITQPDLRRCDTSRFFVTVQNHGSGPSNGLLLEVKLDPELSITSASEPFSQSGQTIAFSLDAMAGFASKTIELRAKLSCDAQISATHAVVATISPIECVTDWNGPVFKLDGKCEGGQVKFEMKNIGSGANASTSYQIFVDDLLFGGLHTIDLPANAPAEILTLPADGHTWRVELAQAPGYPAPSQPAVSIEGCGVGANGLHSIALRNAWRFDDSAPEIAAVLAPSTTGLANKIAEATHGFGLYNFIGDKDWFEFTARVENPLPTQAHGVEFKLSFSAPFDIRTFQPLAWNAPVSYELDNNGVISVKMPGAVLDTSGPGAVAMLRFRIRPLPDVPADSGSYSLFVASGDAYVENTGPYPLVDGFLNYSKTFLSDTDVYNAYGPDVLRFGGRSYDFGTCLAQASDGNIFMGGESSSYSDRTYNDGLIIKANTKGKAQWLTAIDLGDGASNTIRGIAPLPDGGCMVVGNYYPKTATNNYLSEYTPYIARISASGKMLWHKKFRPYGSQYGAWAYGIIATPDGNLLVYGYSESAFGNDQYYQKITTDGNLIWSTTEAIEGSAFRPQKAIPTLDGGYIFVGSNNSTVVNFDIYLEKIDGNGNKLWGKGHNPEEGIFLGSFAPAPDGGYMVLGYTQWEADTNDYVTTPLFVKFTSDGIFEWEKMPIIGSWKSARTYNIVADPTGGYFVTGEIFVDALNHYNDILLLKIDNNADTLWWKHFGSLNTEWAEDLLLTSSNNIVLWGFNQSRPPLYDLQCVFVQTDLQGNVPATEPSPQPSRQQVMVMPNPARDATKVSLLERDGKSIHWNLSRISGGWNQEGVSSGPSFDLDLKDLPAGVYILSFPGENLPTQKLVVVK